MVVAISVISSSLSIAISLIKLANHIREGVESYEKYGDRLVSIEKDLSLCKRHFEQWMDWYEIGKEDDGGKGVRFFGEDGWQYVQDHIARIDERMIGIIKLLSSLTKSPTDIAKYERAASERLPGNRLKKSPPKDIQEEIDFLESLAPDRQFALISHKEEAVRVQEKASIWAKISNILFPNLPGLAIMTADLKLKLGELEFLSTRTAGLNHPSLAFSSDSHLNLSASVAKIWEVEVSLQQRLAATSVYTILQSDPIDNFQLGLQLDMYQMLAKDWKDVSYGFVTEPWAQNRTYSVLSVTCIKTRVETQSPPLEFPIAIKIALSAPGETTYTSASTGDLILAVSVNKSSGNWKKYRVADLTTNRKHFDLDQRFELAFRVADSGLRLLGTNWLSAMESQNLFLLQEINNKASMWSLAFGEVERKTPNILAQIEDAMRTPGVPNSQKYFWQSYSIGLILIELATETKILDLHFPHDDIPFRKSFLPVSLTVEFNKSEHTWTIDFAMRFVQQRFGENFCNAVHSYLHIAKFQLDHEDEDLRTEEEQRLVSFFYRNVFQPLKALRDMRSARSRARNIPRSVHLG